MDPVLALQADEELNLHRECGLFPMPRVHAFGQG